MTIIKVKGAIDVQGIAEEFPGALTFRGAAPEALGITEIEGHVDEAKLREVVQRLHPEAKIRRFKIRRPRESTLVALAVAVDLAVRMVS